MIYQVYSGAFRWERFSPRLRTNSGRPRMYSPLYNPESCANNHTWRIVSMPTTAYALLRV